MGAAGLHALRCSIANQRPSERGNIGAQGCDDTSILVFLDTNEYDKVVSAANLDLQHQRSEVSRL